MLSGTALAFARAIGEFGSTVLISGNIPFKTQVASVHIFGQIESDNITGAAAVSTVLLVVALVVLRRASTCSSAGRPAVARVRRLRAASPCVYLLFLLVLPVGLIVLADLRARARRRSSTR